MSTSFPLMIDLDLQRQTEHELGQVRKSHAMKSATFDYKRIEFDYFEDR